MKIAKTKSKLFTNTEYIELFDFRLKGKKKNYAVWWKMKPKLEEFVKLSEKYLEQIKELLNGKTRG